ncbi:MAG TPA: OmpA family protein [Steroidobacteraceae bacterium]|nr:OmpA family protein [Steroidobacteraceae bacterium]
MPRSLGGVPGVAADAAVRDRAIRHRLRRHGGRRRERRPGAGIAAAGRRPGRERRWRPPRAADIHFDFDSAGITPAYAGMISAHGRSLALDERLRVRLEGNTDERGSPQYNVGSGARRAQAVRRALRLQGAREIEVATVSYGAERPVVEGHDESARAQNRRVDVVYPANR